MNYSQRALQIEPSATVAVGNLAAELQSQGVDIVDLSVGEPDMGTPKHIVDVAQQALADGHTGYTASNGIPALREAIADSLRERGVPNNAEDIIVTPGAKQAIFEAVQALVDAGDEVVLIDPAWVSYEPIVRLAGGSVTRVDTTPHGFQLESALENLAGAIDNNTELVVVNSPSNPTGAVYSETALKGLRDLAVDHDVTVISDEIYGELTYDGNYTSCGAIDGMAERTVTINGFSKAYAMTGWRLGYMAAPSGLVEQAGKIHTHSVTCASNFAQHAAIEALENGDAAVGEMVDTFHKRRDFLVERLTDEDVAVSLPDGAFYLMVPVDENDQQWCERALSEAHVATVPGSAFGAPGYARFAYTCSRDRLAEAVDRLADSGFI
ncbi:pyridoxal phosphate-dependent aminotransferase [Natronosalvus rutilus]|uniref:Aminotransferase n=1 Tax=Natronosalvus rutilus TaxID=2953753 RepID=A0A9E7NDX1_9EURY|nr:pyridoxal phosphate-dependent aminotransferase [Natronosalvus rutilus]UTF55711.1 pyridoxal phosphate-dependent aminotransferase [Natronosalvus rutilus]